MSRSLTDTPAAAILCFKRDSELPLQVWRTSVCLSLSNSFLCFGLWLLVCGAAHTFIPAFPLCSSICTNLAAFVEDFFSQFFFIWLFFLFFWVFFLLFHAFSMHIWWDGNVSGCCAGFVLWEIKVSPLECEQTNWIFVSKTVVSSQSFTAASLRLGLNLFSSHLTFHVVPSSFCYNRILPGCEVPAVKPTFFFFSLCPSSTFRRWENKATSIPLACCLFLALPEQQILLPPLINK